MANSSSGRSPTQTNMLVLGGVAIAAFASIAAAPATTPDPACRPSMVHFIAEPKPLSAKPILRVDWPVLERLASPYAQEAEPPPPPPPLVQEALNSEPVVEAEKDPPRKHRRHRRWR